jgi:hypothetical protein
MVVVCPSTFFQVVQSSALSTVMSNRKLMNTREDSYVQSQQGKYSNFFLSGRVLNTEFSTGRESGLVAM